MNLSSFFYSSASFVSGAFALGAVSAIYLQYRTRVVRFLLLFILSLFLISSGYWTMAISHIPNLATPFLPYALLLLQSAGSILNVIIVPYLICSLINLNLNQRIVMAMWGWNILFILISLSAYLFPSLFQYRSISSYMMVITIFLYISAINGCSFFFAGAFLNRGAYADGKGVTELFCGNFEITRRESELVNKLLEGKSNKEIGDELCISLKTVENHLGSIYRKTDVTGRGQLIHMLHSWERG